jgi:hypothetical protein
MTDNIRPVPTAQTYLDAVARRVLDQNKTDPLSMAVTTVFVPDADTGFALRQAFIAQLQGIPAVMPNIEVPEAADRPQLALQISGDAALSKKLAALPPPISPLKRQLLLAGEVLKIPGLANAPQAIALADALGQALDQAERNNVSPDALGKLLPADLKKDAAQTAALLRIVTQTWPQKLKELNASDPEIYRNTILNVRAEFWRSTTHADPVFAVGFSESAPAMNNLLKTVAALPKGEVVPPAKIPAPPANDNSLSATNVGSYLLATAAMAAGKWAPAPTLEALHSPLAALGENQADFSRQVSDLENLVFKGSPPPPGADGVKQALTAAFNAAAKHPGQRTPEQLAASQKELTTLVDQLQAAGKNFFGLMASDKPVPFAQMLDAHINFVEALAKSDKDTGAWRVWRGDDGVKAAYYLRDLRATAALVPAVTGAEYTGTLQNLLHNVKVQQRQALDTLPHFRPSMAGKPANDNSAGWGAPSPLRPSQDSNDYYKNLGTDVHAMLELLPHLPPAERKEAAREYLADPALGIRESDQAQVLNNVGTILNNPAFASLYGPTSRAEVSISGLVDKDGQKQMFNGIIDRMLITDKEVYIIDYKSNMKVPKDFDDAAKMYDEYLLQLASYRMAIQQIYPGRDVKCALLFTREARLIPLPEDKLDDAAARMHLKPYTPPPAKQASGPKV